jgi:hypothetical protein
MAGIRLKKTVSNALSEAKHALKEARKFWPALHERDPNQLDRFALKEFRRDFLFYVKQIDFLFMALDPKIGMLRPDFEVPAVWPPLANAEEEISEALKWFVNSANSTVVTGAVIRSIFQNKSPEVAPYFVRYAFPVFFNHFSTY